MTSPPCPNCGHPIQVDRPCEQCRFIGEWMEGVPCFAYGRSKPPLHKEAGIYAAMAIEAMFDALDSALTRIH